METNYFALHNGKIVYVPDVPEPKKLYTSDFKEFKDYNEAFTANLNDYKQVLQSAIASGIEVENQDQTEDELLDAHGTHHGFRLDPDKLYSMQCRVEIRELWGFPESIARVTFEQPKENTGIELIADATYTAGRICDFLNEPEAAGQEQNKTAEEILTVIGGHWGQRLSRVDAIKSMEEYASQQTASLQKQVEELRKEKERLKEWKREMMQLNKSIFDWGHSKETELQIGSSIFAEAAKRLYAYRHLESENAAANKRIEELFKEKQELERKYNLLRYGSED